MTQRRASFTAAVAVITLLAVTRWNGEAAVRSPAHGRTRFWKRVADNNNSSSGGTQSVESGNDIAFDLPDLIASADTPHGTVQLEAFRSTNNDQIIREPGMPRSSQLIWVSIGQPNFVRTSTRLANGSLVDGQLFRSTFDGFHTYVQMMTPTHRKLLATVAAFKYRVDVKEEQIVNLILSTFDCSLLLYDATGAKYLVKGAVTDFSHFPLRMDFVAPPGSTERRLFQDAIAAWESELRFQCNLVSKGKKMLTNTLSITSQQSELIGLESKILGPAGSTGTSSVFVTREQSSLLSHEMYSTLNIVEDYQMPASQFTDAFVDGLISQVATQAFHMEPVDTALASLSKYSFDMTADLRPDIIKRDLGSIMKVDNRGEKSRIILNTENSNKDEESTSTSGEVSGSGFGVQASAKWAYDNEKSNSAVSKSLNDQLRELNTASQNDVQWTIEGEKVVPKNLNVAQFSRAKFSKTLTFSRVRVQRIDAAFDKDFGMYASRATLPPQLLEFTRTLVDGLAARIVQLNTTLNATAVRLVADTATTLAKQDADWKLADTRLYDYYRSIYMSFSNEMTVLKGRTRLALTGCRVCFHQVDAAPWFDKCTAVNSGITEKFQISYDHGKARNRLSIECQKLG